ncbi:EamA family transporter RarD [Leeia sp.]|uniref:EamA family transporter RarD n=1 Tax=Leeia sp. TaxID=2884678 RepID=UPI0035B4825C
MSAAQIRQGIWYGLGAYFCWGLFPLYWRPLHALPATEILAHRMVWSLPVLIVLLAWQGDWRQVLAALRQWRSSRLFLCSALLLGCNWGVYIWAVNQGKVLEASLGYFINPLVNVLLGSVLLHERLRPGQWLSVALAAAGVAWLGWQLGTLPWVALVLAFSFGFYGFLRKTAALGSLEGLSMEAILLFLPALGYLLWLSWQGQGHFGHIDSGRTLLLMGTGIVTVIPLLMFGAGARRLPLSTLGLLQYLSPTLQLLIGALLYHEPFDQVRLIGFGLIWLALLVFTAEGFWQRRN